MIRFIPNNFSFNFPIELYLPLLERSESALFLNVFFLFEVYKAALNNILPFFFVNDPGVGFFEV
jgi:hypothetical protein